MSPLPEQLADRWRDRLEPRPGEGWLYWHILFRDHPDVRALARTGQRRIASFRGLHLVPQEWLHVTALVVGSTDRITDHDVETMTATARRLLAQTTPVTMTFGRVLYHPEAIALEAQPQDALRPVLDALQTVTRLATGSDGIIEYQPWTPHLTLAYSTAVQPAAPVIDALGRELPACEATIRNVDLVVQVGPERLWDWRSIATVALGKERLAP